MSSFLEYVPGTSPLHRMNPVAKLGAAALFAIACFCTSNLVFLAVLLATMIVVALLGRLLRGVCHLAGLGVADVVLGILFSLAKTVVVLSLCMERLMMWCTRRWALEGEKAHEDR